MENVQEVLDRSRKLISTYRRESNAQLGFWYYQPLPYQEKWFKSDKPIKLILAGNRVGKTTALVVKWLLEGTGQNPVALGGEKGKWREGHLKGKRILLAGESFKSVKQTILPHLEEYLDMGMLTRPPTRGQEGAPSEFHFVSGCTGVIQSYAQSTDKHEGGRWDFIGLDEPPPEQHFKTLMRGTIDNSGQIWVTATPLKGEWMQDVLIKPSQDPKSELHNVCDYFRVDMHENCKECNGGYLPHAKIAQYLATLSEHERAARAHGVFLERTGVEYSYVSRETHVVENFTPPPDWPVVEIIDPSAKRGIFVIWACVDPQENWTIFHAKRTQDGAMDFLCNAIKSERSREMLAEPTIAICDQRFGPHLANKVEQTTWFQEFQKRGLMYQPSTDGLHETLHDWLRVKIAANGEKLRPKLVMTEKVADMEEGPLWGTERYRWKPEQSYKERYQQKGKDWIDLMRYLSGHPGLSYERLSSRVKRRVGAEERKPPLNRTYVSSKSRTETPMQRKIKMAIPSRTRRSLRKQGWHF